MAILGFIVCSACADEEFIWSGPGCVLLKNGNVLTAIDIVPQGKIVSVRLDETGEVRLAAKDIVKIGRDKLELYQHQVSKTTRWEAGEHWQLAKWCIRQGLIEQSQVHYDQLKRISGNHVKFKQLDSELKQALLQDPVMKAALKSAYPTFESNDTLEEPAGNFRPSWHEDDKSKSTVPTSNQRKTVTPAVNLDRYTQDYFRTQLQPFLAMRCGQAGCHGAYGKSEFHIAKSGVLRGLSANEISLQSAVQFLDDENIEATKLWINATSPHGSQTTPSLTTKDSSERELLSRLRHWHQAVMKNTSAVTMSPMVPVPSEKLIASPPRLSTAASESFPALPVTTANQIVKLGPYGNQVSQPKVSTPDLGDDLMMLEREIAKLEEKERARKAPKRHDPEEFNRRFGTATP